MKPIEKNLLKVKYEIFSGKYHLIDIARKWFKTVQDLSDDDTHAYNNIAYTNATVDTINNYYNDLTRPNGIETVVVGDRHFYTGLEVVCKERIKLNIKDKIFVNYNYKIGRINKKLTELIDEFAQKKYIIPTAFLEKFMFVHAMTCHMAQGQTLNGRVTIWEICKPFVTPEWFWVAVTRATSFDNVYVYDP